MNDPAPLRDLLADALDTWADPARQHLPGGELPAVAVSADFAATGASYRQIDHWCRAGYLRPTNPDAGSGTARTFPPIELAVAARMVRLIRAGLTPAAAARVARGNHDLAPGVRVLLDDPQPCDERTA